VPDAGSSGLRLTRRNDRPAVSHERLAAPLAHESQTLHRSPGRMSYDPARPHRFAPVARDHRPSRDAGPRTIAGLFTCHLHGTRRNSFGGDNGERSHTRPAVVTPVLHRQRRLLRPRSLSAAETRPDGATEILVAVADATALVAQGSVLDDRAKQNTTPVYTAARIFPMLPEKLSTDLTSLKLAVDRLAVVIEMTFSPDGSLAAADIYPATVRNRAKLANKGVAAWLDETTPASAANKAIPGPGENIRPRHRFAGHRLKNAGGNLGPSFDGIAPAPPSATPRHGINPQASPVGANSFATSDALGSSPITSKLAHATAPVARILDLPSLSSPSPDSSRSLSVPIRAIHGSVPFA